ncbi:MAG: hypothetical protein E6I46_05445 [Chloroflexi bacterium]|nr:MAG: hypothetical protein E6I46_05445 [Chloroflexota bacterium]
MMLGEIRDRRAGQAIVIMALSMVAICGMLALAIDAGRLYFQRRLMQDAVDAGSLAGAQSLVGTITNPNGLPNYALYYALDDTLSVFNQNPANNDPNSSFYTSPVNDTVTDTQGGYTVTAVAPTGYNDKQVQVTVTYNATATFVQVLGFRQISIIATATAEAGTNAKTYAIFAYGGIGTGNTINIQGSGYAQVDNGQDGNDFCSGTPSGETISNAKFHMPTGYPGMLNINGNVFINQADDNQHLGKYWVPSPPFMAGQDPEPNYLIPDTSNIPNAPTRQKINNLASGASATYGNITVRNTTSLPHDFYIYFPGKYTTSISIPYNPGLDAKDSMYIFANGIYPSPRRAAMSRIPRAACRITPTAWVQRICRPPATGQMASNSSSTGPVSIPPTIARPRCRTTTARSSSPPTTFRPGACTSPSTSPRRTPLGRPGARGTTPCPGRRIATRSGARSSMPRPNRCTSPAHSSVRRTTTRWTTPTPAGRDRMDSIRSTASSSGSAWTSTMATSRATPVAPHQPALARSGPTAATRPCSSSTTRTSHRRRA